MLMVLRFMGKLEAGGEDLFIQIAVKFMVELVHPIEFSTVPSSNTRFTGVVPHTVAVVPGVTVVPAVTVRVAVGGAVGGVPVTVAHPPLVP
jgi:hypothetical protein